MTSESPSPGAGGRHRGGEWDLVGELALCHPGEAWELLAPAVGDSVEDVGRDSDRNVALPLPAAPAVGAQAPGSLGLVQPSRVWVV